MKKLISILLAVSFVVSIAGLYADASFHENADAIATAAESVLMLYCYNKDGDLISSGSGFLAIAEGIIITNYHVVEGDVAFVKAITEDDASFMIDGLLCDSPSADIAILWTEEVTGLPLLELGDSSSVKKGSRVVAIGSPLGVFTNTVSEGLYSSEWEVNGQRRLLFSAAISHGSSGGALFDDNGKVIGVTAGSWEEGQSLNYAIPINTVKQIWELFQNENNVYTGENSGNDSQTVVSTPEPTSKPTPKPTPEPTPDPVIPWAKTVKVGDYVKFGSYEQDNNTANGKEPIEWFVLDVQNGNALLISRYALEVMMFSGSTNWKNSQLRNWLNESLLYEIFSDKEQERIKLTNVSADKNPEYDIYWGSDTTDKIFLLSISEADHYFKSDLDRQCETTEWVKYIYQCRFCRWWLRTPGRYMDNIAFVDEDGSIRNDGTVLSRALCAIRPSLWVDLGS